MLSTRGHAPQDPGAKAIVTAEGLYWGTVGGGKVEARAIKHSQELISKLPQLSGPELHTWNLQHDIGMTCGGEVTYLFETHSQKSWEVVVFGAGHVGQALVRTLIPLECKVTCVDSRPEWSERLPKSLNLEVQCVSEPADYVAKCSPNAFFVVMTRGHAFDMPVVHAIYKTHPEAPYVGVIGSKVKGLKIKNELKALKYDPNFIEKLRCPMGLSLGTNHPAEIALSIAAELVQIRDQVQNRHVSNVVP